MYMYHALPISAKFGCKLQCSEQETGLRVEEGKLSTDCNVHTLTSTPT